MRKFIRRIVDWLGDIDTVTNLPVAFKVWTWGGTMATAVMVFLAATYGQLPFELRMLVAVLLGLTGLALVRFLPDVWVWARSKLSESADPTLRPVLDFAVNGARVLSITNSGPVDVIEVRMRATEYAFGQLMVEPPQTTQLPSGTFMLDKLPRHELVITHTSAFDRLLIDVESIATNGNTTHDLTTLKPLKFTSGTEALMLPPGIDARRPRNPGFCFYALRFTFRHAGTKQKYSHTKVIAAQIKPVFPFDNDGVSFMLPGNRLSEPGTMDMFFQIVPLIIEDQRTFFAHEVVTEY